MSHNKRKQDAAHTDGTVWYLQVVMLPGVLMGLLKFEKSLMLNMDRDVLM